MKEARYEGIPNMKGGCVKENRPMRVQFEGVAAVCALMRSRAAHLCLPGTGSEQDEGMMMMISDGDISYSLSVFIRLIPTRSAPRSHYSHSATATRPRFDTSLTRATGEGVGGE